MFKVNDYIMYGMTGVCQVVDITKESFIDYLGAGVTVGMNPFNLSDALCPVTSFSYVLLRLKGFIPTVTPAPKLSIKLSFVISTT